MPWKMLVYLIVLGILLSFIGLNLGNTTDISLGFTTFEAVPIFMGLFIAFFSGVILTIPVVLLTVSRRTRRKDGQRTSREEAREAKAAAKAEKAAIRAEKKVKKDPTPDTGKVEQEQ
jgi:hypothetical protein